MTYRELLDVFYDINSLFKKNGFSTYLVGGCVRDFLLNKDIFDIDIVTNATPEQMKTFIPEADYTFARFGSVRFTFKGTSLDITTLRKEESYEDLRHPSKIIFCDSLKEDSKRRDFTINALYYDENYKIIDYVGGIDDLNNKTIRMIGDPDIRIKEDPLRILRALRFSINLGFSIKKDLYQSMKDHISLIDKLNPEKIKEEIKKCDDEKKLLDSLNHLKNL